MKKKKNLRQKLLPAIFAAACVPIAVFALISQTRLRKSTLDNIRMQAEADLQKAEECLNMTMDKYETVLYDITTDDGFLNLVLTAYAENGIVEADAYALRREFSHICNRNDGVEGIQLILQDGRRIFYDRLSSSSVNSTWITDIPVVETEGLAAHFADKAFTRNPGVRMFHIMRKIVDYWDIQKEPGYVIMSINMDKLNTVIASGSASQIYLAEDEILVAAADRELVGQQAVVLDQKDVRLREVKNEGSGWTIILSQSMKTYQTAIREQAVFWILVAAVMLLILVVLIYQVTRPVMVSVNDIVAAMESLEKEKFRTRLLVKESDSREVQRISEGFNEMAERTRTLIEKVKASAIEQKNAEISAMEAQIDPHFLYNILDTINWKAIEQDQYEISDMLVALADILRYGINDAGELVTVQAEKAWLEKYLLLHQAKLGEEIEAEFILDERVRGCKIHKMLMQPFIENAVKYGFHGSAGGHKLLVKMTRAENQLHILIENNGKPIGQSVLEQLNKGVERKNHLGIQNVRKRLQLYYGDAAALYFESLGEAGMRVHLFVPVQEGGINEDRSN